MRSLAALGDTRHFVLLWMATGLVGVAIVLSAIETTGDLVVLPWLLALPLGVLAFRDPERRGCERRDLVAVSFLLALGLASRLVLLDRWPSFINPDEPIFGLLAVDLLDGKTQAFVRGWLGEPYVSLVPFTVGLRLLGQNILALRVPSGAIGGLAIPALYLTGKEAFDRTVGFFAALFLLASVPVFHISRTGLANVEALTLMTFGAGALVAVARQPDRWRQWAILGLTLGLALCVFSAAMIWIPIAGLTLLPLFWRLSRWPNRLAPVALPLFAGFLIAAAPMLVYLLRAPGDLGGHALSMAVWNKDSWDHEIYSYHLSQGDTIGVWRIQVQHSVAGLLALGDTQQDYGSERGLLDPVAGVCFIVGALVLVARWQQPASLLLVAWVGLSLLLGSIIIVDPPQTTKLIVMMPAACLIAGVGLAAIIRTLLDNRQAAAILCFGAAGVVIGAAFGFTYYFGRYQLVPSQTPTLLSEYAAMVQDQRAVCLVNLGIPPSNELIRFLAPRAKVFAWDTTKPAPALPNGEPLAFVYPAAGDGSQRAQAAVRERFPTGSARVLSDSNHRPTLQVWEVPAQLAISR